MLEKQISFVEKQVGETKNIYDKVTGYYQAVVSIIPFCQFYVFMITVCCGRGIKISALELKRIK